MLPIFGGNVPDQGYKIERSLRFNSADSAYLNRTPTAASNRKTWTWSGWVKRRALTNQFIFCAGPQTAGTQGTDIRFDANSLYVSTSTIGSSVVWSVQTTAIFRDVGAWYHIVISVDTTQATASERVRIYVNGNRITQLTTANYPTQNYDAAVNNNVAHQFGYSGVYLDGYLTEVHFIDGVALGPGSFGEIDSITGVWNPKKYTGVYGQNGFYLPFKNNTSTTALGFDYSGASSSYNATVVGNAQISTAQSKFGGSSAYFDGTGDYLTLTNKEYLGADDFTVEFWVNTTQITGGGRAFIYINGNSTNYAALRFYTDSSVNQYGLAMSTNGTSWAIATFSAVSATGDVGVWRHFAICRSGTSVKVYRDGVEIISSTLSGTLMTGDRTWIGNITANHYLYGYMDDLRVYRGVCKYTASFTPPTAALPVGNSDSYWQYCQIAMPMDGINASTTIPAYSPNTWTANNFSVTAGTGNDSLVDVPTLYGSDTGLGGQVRGNYCTFNPLNFDPGIGTPTVATALKNGNLELTFNSSAWSGYRTTMVVSSGKWYVEMNTTAGGLASASNLEVVNSASNTATSPVISISTSVGVADTIAIALDLDNGTYTSYRNNATIASGNITIGPLYCFRATVGNSPNSFLNFGQRPFTYTAPSGYKALCSANLP
jgi:hypothetical protein